MIIRYAEPADRRMLSNLWKSSFGDDDSYIEHFLNEMWLCDNCLVIDEEGLIVSMLFLLPAEIVVQSQYRPLWYIYACATLPEYRGFGYMRQLLDSAYEEATNRSVFALFLIPASESLFLFYEKSRFHRLSTRYIPVDFQIELSSEIGSVVSEEVLKEIMFRRNTYLTDELDVCWGKDHLRFVLNDLVRNGGGYVLSGTGYCLIENKGGHYIVKERLPEMKSRTTAKDYAMIRFCQPNEPGLSVISPYINLVLD